MQQLLNQLRHPDPDQRRAAIKSIAQLRDQRTLPALKNICENDPEPDVRDLAFKAGKFIVQQTRNHPSQSPVQPEPTSSGPNPYMPQLSFSSTMPLETNVSRQDEARARSFLDRAADFQLSGQTDKAIENLVRAFDHNPNLKQDTLAVGLAAQITGLQGQFAINALLQNDNRDALLKNARKNQPKNKKSSNKIAWKDLPGWSWLFIVACAAIPIISLGGLVPGAIGFGAAAGCASVAGDNSRNTTFRMVLCAGITIFAWALFIGFLILVASSGVAG